MDPWYSVLRNILLRDKLVAPDLLERCAAIKRKIGAMRNTYGVKRLLCSIEDPFIADLELQVHRLHVWANDDVHIQTLNLRLGDSRGAHRGRPTYAGKMVCRFERSTLEEHASRWILFIRVLKIIEPVRCLVPDYDGYMEEPKEGALISRHGTAVSIDLENSDAWKAFRMLYDLPYSSSSA